MGGLFHTLLAGHSANYLSRGTHWGSEQRLQQHKGGILDERWTNNCGDGGEDCSLCMVSSLPPAMWIRWMLVQEDRDVAQVHLARGAPKRWYSQAERFGIAEAPTRMGLVSFSLSVSGERVQGSVAMKPHPNSGVRLAVRCSVRLISPQWQNGSVLNRVQITSGDAAVLTLHRENSTAVFELKNSASSFDFIASFSAESAATFV